MFWIFTLSYWGASNRPIPIQALPQVSFLLKLKNADGFQNSTAFFGISNVFRWPEPGDSEFRPRVVSAMVMSGSLPEGER